MSRTIELPEDVYARIEAEASASGVTVSEWIAAVASRPCDDPLAPPSANGGDTTDTRTMADRLAGRIGTLRSGRSDASERTGELFAQGLREKYEKEQTAARALQTGESSGPDVDQNGGVEGAGSHKTPRTLADLAEGLVGQVAGDGPHDLARNHSKYMGEYLEEEDRRRRP